MRSKYFAPAMAGGMRRSLAAGASVLAVAIAGSAFAQPVDTVPTPEEDSARPRDEVVVTGSRIRRSEFTSASPVQIINPEIGELQGQFDTAGLVQSSSIAAGSAQITSAISSNFVTNGGQGAATISLRGLGADRTLVLLNGRRAGPAGVRGAVNAFDLNVIPQSVIGTVEILKDGASSVYGSDAVAGVVNIITKRDQDGLSIDGFLSKPFDEGGEEFRGSVTWGKEFDRGHFQASFDYYKRTELKRGHRDYLSCSEDYVYSPTRIRADLVDPRTGDYKCRDLLWGHVWLYDYSYIYSPNPSNTVAANGQLIRRMQYNYAGDNLGSYIPGLTPPADPFQLGAPPGFFPVGYDPASYAVENWHHPFYDQDTVIPETTRFTFYADGALKLNDTAELYTEFLLNRRWNYVNGSRQFWQFGFTSQSTLPDLFFGDPSPGDPFAPGWTGDYLISPTAITDHSDQRIEVDYMRAVAGLRGDFGNFLDGWRWDVYGQQARSRGKYRFDQILNDSVSLHDFRTSSCAGVVTPVGGRNCIDIDWNQPGFLAGVFTDAQRAYLFDTEDGLTKYRQSFVEAVIDGNLFSTAAGPVGMVIGGQWRRDFIEDTPGPITLSGNAWGNTGAGVTTGSSTTKEIFGEVDIPLFKDAGPFQSFTVNGAVRYTDVSTAGDDVTWKVGLNWQVNDWIRLRGTMGTSFRAPALFELYLADQTSFTAQRNVDPCIQWANNLASGLITQQIANNCAADGIPGNFTGGSVTATIITGGGLGVLAPETSKAKTASIILTPDWLFGDRTKFQMAVDYFNIEVNGQIAQLGARNVVAGCYASDFFPTDPLCSLFTRGQTAAPLSINTVRDSFINVNSQRNSGIDVTGKLNHELPGSWGDIEILAQYTVQFKDTIALFEGTEVSTNGEDGEPRWVGDVNFTWKNGGWTVFWGMDMVGPTSDEGDYLDRNGTLCPTIVTLGGQVCYDLTAEMTIYHTASITKDFGDRVRLTVGVANLFDEHPPAVTTRSGEISTLGRSSFQSNYDLIGRRAFLNLKASF